MQVSIKPRDEGLDHPPTPRSWMSMSSDFSRDPVRDSAPDHSGYGDSEHCGPESLHPTLMASAARVRVVLARCVLTTHYRIQDSAFVTHAADGSRSPDLQHQSMPYGPSPRRGSARDTFHSPPIHRGATNVEDEWFPFVDSPDPVRTQGPVQRNHSHDHFAFSSSWNNGIYDPPVADSSLLDVGEFTLPINNTEFPSWPQGVYTHDPFTLYPDLVHGETPFPQDSGPLIQPPFPPHYAARPVSTVEHAMSNQAQLSRSGSQGPTLIVDQNYVRREMPAWRRYSTFDSQDSSTQHSTFGSGLPNSDASFSPGMRMAVVPQRPYAKKGGREKQRSIIFKVNGRLGIPARDALGRNYVGLEGRDNQVFVDEAGVITLRLEVGSVADCEVFGD